MTDSWIQQKTALLYQLKMGKIVLKLIYGNDFDNIYSKWDKGVPVEPECMCRSH